MEKQFVMKDGGSRESFGSGALREEAHNKGRYDLISPYAMRRLAIIYEKGAVKYANRNWEKGMPFCRTFDSAMRHLQQWLMGMNDEDHLGQALWNVAALIHYEEGMGRGLYTKELDDRPDFKEKKE